MPDSEDDPISRFQSRLRRATMLRATGAIALGLVAAIAGVVMYFSVQGVALTPRGYLQGAFGGCILAALGLVVASVGGIVLVRAALRR